jgi:hypothetical protein
LRGEYRPSRCCANIALPAFEQYQGLLAEAPAAQIAFLTQALRLYAISACACGALGRAHGQGDHQEALDVVRQVPADHQLARQARFLAPSRCCILTSIRPRSTSSRS